MVTTLDPVTFSRLLPWAPIAALSYLGTVTLGTVSLRGRRMKRVWHTRFFVVTVTLTLLAALLSFATRWQSGVLLLLALVPLALLPSLTAPVRKQTRRHIAIGLSAAPFYLGAVVFWALGVT